MARKRKRIMSTQDRYERDNWIALVMVATLCVGVMWYCVMVGA